MSVLKLSIIVPVRNEGISLKYLIRIMEAVVEPPHEVLVVHDFPDDDSVPVVNAMQAEYPNVRLVYNTYGQGVVYALRAGVEAAVGEYILIYAADEVGPVMAIEDMLALVEDGCDLVNCTRYAHGGRRLGGSFIGGLLSRIANRLFIIVAKAAATDSTTGMKMFRREIFDRLRLEAKPVGWVVAFEMAIKAQLEGLNLGEVPVVSIDRLFGGESTFRLGPWFVEYFRWFVWGAFHLRSASGGKTPPVRVRIPSATVK